MKHNVTVYDLLLSCPGDAYESCYTAVKKAIEKFNADPQINKSISIVLKHWSVDSYPQSGGQPQKLLNEQIVNGADMAVAIFWTRFGTPTDDYGSGTEEEINLLLKNNKQVFLYFLNKPIPLSLTDSPDYIENREKINCLKEKYNGLYCEVQDENELLEKIVRDLKLYFSKLNCEVENKINRWYRSDTGQEIKPTELLKYGNFKTQIDGNVARAEIIKPDGKTVYAEMNIKDNSVSNIVADGFPQEYVIDIPKNLIINKKEDTITVDGALYRLEVYLLKFNGFVQALYDLQNNKLQDINAKAPAGMRILVDTTNNKIHLVNEMI